MPNTRPEETVEVQSFKRSPSTGDSGNLAYMNYQRSYRILLCRPNICWTFSIVILDPGELYLGYLMDRRENSRICMDDWYQPDGCLDSSFKLHLPDRWPYYISLFEISVHLFTPLPGWWPQHPSYTFSHSSTYSKPLGGIFCNGEGVGGKLSHIHSAHIRIHTHLLVLACIPSRGFALMGSEDPISLMLQNRRTLTFCSDGWIGLQIFERRVTALRVVLQCGMEKTANQMAFHHPRQLPHDNLLF